MDECPGDALPTQTGRYLNGGGSYRIDRGGTGDGSEVAAQRFHALLRARDRSSLAGSGGVPRVLDRGPSGVLAAPARVVPADGRGVARARLHVRLLRGRDVLPGTAPQLRREHPRG